MCVWCLNFLKNKLISFYFDYVIISVIYLNKDIFTKLFIFSFLNCLNWIKTETNLKLQKITKKIKSNFNQIYELTSGIFENFELFLVIFADRISMCNAHECTLNVLQALVHERFGLLVHWRGKLVQKSILWLVKENSKKRKALFFTFQVYWSLLITKNTIGWSKENKKLPADKTEDQLTEAW